MVFLEMGISLRYFDESAQQRDGVDGLAENLGMVGSPVEEELHVGSLRTQLRDI